MLSLNIKKERESEKNKLEMRLYLFLWKHSLAAMVAQQEIAATAYDEREGKKWTAKPNSKP